MMVCAVYMNYIRIQITDAAKRPPREFDAHCRPRQQAGDGFRAAPQHGRFPNEVMTYAVHIQRRIPAKQVYEVRLHAPLPYRPRQPPVKGYAVEKSLRRWSVLVIEQR